MHSCLSSSKDPGPIVREQLLEIPHDLRPMGDLLAELSGNGVS